ncbi:MAG: phosphoribosylglycinamide formyltransferase [Alphaproteobacteria bacterium]
MSDAASTKQNVTKRKIAVLVSGRGSNLKALAAACAQPDFPAEIALVFSNRPNAQALSIAADYGIPTQTLDHKEFEDRTEFDAAVSEIIDQSGAQLVCLAGYMRLFSEEFVNRWRDRMINIHPALLPAFKGLHVHERAIEAGVKITGATVHFVRLGTDEGPIIIQGAVPVLPDDTPETLEARILTVEHKIYPEAVRMIAQGHTRIVNERVEIVDEAPSVADCFIVPHVAIRD